MNTILKCISPIDGSVLRRAPVMPLADGSLLGRRAGARKPDATGPKHVAPSKTASRWSGQGSGQPSMKDEAWMPDVCL